MTSLEALKEIKKCMVQNCDYAEYYKEFETIEKELKDKEKFEELVNIDLDLFMKAVDIKGLIEDYQKFKKVLEILKNKKVDIWTLGISDKLSYYHYCIGAKSNKSLRLTREEWNLLKEVLS